MFDRLNKPSGGWGKLATAELGEVHSQLNDAIHYGFSYGAGFRMSKALIGLK